MITQNLPPLHLSCSTDNMRPAFMNVFIDGEYGVTTTGHALVKCKLDMIDSEVLKAINGFQIPAKTWKLWCSKDAIEFQHLDGKPFVLTTYGLIQILDKTDTRFPEYRKSVENIKGDGVSKFGMDPNILSLALKSVGATSCQIQTFEMVQGFFVSPLFCDFEAEILFMPMMTSEEELVKPFEIINK